ncbi:uncharacterized protein LOC113518376 [Galleria mellonella]|uniref:Uncharacterized protein LOC113518376 n=1 Tax=Galleria mellonella TaxID=7137 RepID=A0A6J1WTK9_GALME|nr:uncharacterized protein LOC113518376 [Galleria mellonella]
MWLEICFALLAISNTSCDVSSKMDFENEQDSVTTVVSNSSKVENEDVEVKHTIVVSTKLKNNNRRGLHSSSDGDSGILTYNVGHASRPNKDTDSGEVPVVPGFKAIETTQIRTPDSRQKGQIYPDSVFINRNIRDEYDVIPNIATNPMQWKPSNYFNNINWWGSSGHGERQPNFVRRIDRPTIGSPNNFHRKITIDGMREFYCRKCMEMSNGQMKGCIQQRSKPWYIIETTTNKVKLDGKLAKLN